MIYKLFGFLVTRVIKVVTTRLLKRRGKLRLLMWLMVNLGLKDVAAKRIRVWYPLLTVLDLML